ncbi:MAG: DUF3562 domain-containing protein [Gammaproteobacteria bacterium]
MHLTHHSDKEHQKHSKAITSIADQYHLNEKLIREIYEDELNKLQMSAKFSNFLPLLTTRHVKELLHKSGITAEDNERRMM